MLLPTSYVADEHTTFFLTAHDAFLNPERNGDAAVVATMRSRSDDELKQVFCGISRADRALDRPIALAVRNLMNGTYELAFTAPSVSHYNLEIKLNQRAIKGSPFVVVVTWAGLSNEIILIAGGGLVFFYLMAFIIVYFARKYRKRAAYEKIRP